MKKNRQLLTICLTAMIWMSPVKAFDSGSTGVDGDFSPTSSTTLTLPANGIFNFSSINIPIGVTVNFIPNQLNTPVMILVSGDAVINGDINISGVDGDNFGPEFVTIPPGGFAGGQRVYPDNDGSNGLGPGGGHGGANINGVFGCGGAGAGYTNNGAPLISSCVIVPTGSAYGSATLQPLIGGSGGGGGGNSSTAEISGAGGSGGGALLLAVSGTLTLNGEIIAKGGSGEAVSLAGLGSGGGGSGGAVRLVTTEFAGQGSINVLGGLRGVFGNPAAGSQGSFGRIRTEFETSTFTGTIQPGAANTIAMPTALFFANVPTIRITSIAGQSVSQIPTGNNDVILPSDTINPVIVEIATTQVSVGETVKITVTPNTGAVVSVDSTPLTGLIENATASANIDLTLGASVITASVNFSVTTAQSNALLQFTDGEPIKQIALSSTLGKESTMTLITASGKSYVWPQNAALLMN